MGDDFSDLSRFTICEHGDAREQAVWPVVSTRLGEYEAFWQALIVLLTNRIDPVSVGPDWIRMRSNIPEEYELPAMHNYSLFYYVALARRAIDNDRQRHGAGEYTHPERVFFALQVSVERSKDLQALARTMLRQLGMNWKFPKHPESTYQTIGVYRNAFAHDPVLGRAIDQGRELLPRQDRLPVDGKPRLASFRRDSRQADG
jgi:hypothetical protein